MNRTPFLACLILLLLGSLPCKASDGVRVLLLAGQSNMAGRGTFAELDEALKARIIAASSRVQVSAGERQAQPLSFRKPGEHVKEFGPEMLLGLTLAECYPDNEYLLVKTAVGGTSLHGAWSPDWTAEKAKASENGEARQQMKLYSDHVKSIRDNLDTLKKQGKPFEIEGIFWMQGEKDSRRELSATNYESNLKKLIAAYRTDFEQPDLPFFFGQINAPLRGKKDFQAGPETVRSAMSNVALSVPSVVMIPTTTDPSWSDFPKRADNVHYNTEGQTRLGTSFANALMNLKQQDVGSSMPQYRIGVCDWSIKMKATGESFLFAKKAGLQGIQFSFDVEGKGLDIRTKENRDKLRAIVKETNVEIASLGIGLLNKIPLAKTEEADQLVSDCLDAMIKLKEEAVALEDKELAAKVSPHIVLLAFFGKGNINDDPEGIKVVIEKLKHFAPIAEKHGFVLGIESLLSEADHRHIMESVGSPAVKVYYDTANSARMGYDIYKEIESLGAENICQIHLKQDKELLGQGDIDFPRVKTLLEKTKYQGWLIIEGSTPKGMSKTKSCEINTVFTKQLFNGLPKTSSTLPEPPEGFHWEVNEAFTDEFNGTELDSTKWHDHNPDWIGRPPGKFVPSSVSVKDGLLAISCTPLDPPDGKFDIACGTIQSKASDALFGYYECSMKASQLSTSSNFWMVGKDFEVDGGRVNVELIVQLTVGNAKGLMDHIKSNAMTSFKSTEPGSKRKKAKKTERAKLDSNVGDDFHTYGVWWVDANTLKFYADGKHVYTINPSTEFDDKPFRHPLTVNFVCETFDWQPEPTKEELTAPKLNTTYVDYVRSFKLIKSN